MALTERPDEHGLPLIVDLDLRWDGPERQYTLEHVDTFVRTYTQVLLGYVGRVFDDDGVEHVASFHGLKWWVLEKRSPRPAKLDSTCAECKDGLHLVCANVITPAIVQQQARCEWLASAENRRLLEQLSTSTADKVFDDSVLSGRQQWFLYGSRKPEGDPHPWRVTYSVTEGSMLGTKMHFEVRDGSPGESELAFVQRLSLRRFAASAPRAHLAMPFSQLTDKGRALLLPCSPHQANQALLHPPSPTQQPEAQPEVHSATNGPSACAHLPLAGLSQGCSEVARARPSQLSDSAAEAWRLVNMLSPRRADDYQTWINVGLCLHSIPAVELLAAWEQFSMSSSKYQPGECARKWASMGSPAKTGQRRLGMGSLRFWAREDSPDAYGQQATDALFTSVRLCNGSHSEVANIAVALLSDRFVCATSDGKLWYRFDGSLWREDSNTLQLRHELSTTVRGRFMAAVNQLATPTQGATPCNSIVSDRSAAGRSTEAQEASQRLLRIALRLQDARFKDDIVREMRELMYDETFLQRLDSDPNLLGFTNGVWQLSAGRFRPATPEDCVSMSVGYAYSDEPDEAANQIMMPWSGATGRRCTLTPSSAGTCNACSPARCMATAATSSSMCMQGIERRPATARPSSLR